MERQLGLPARLAKAGARQTSRQTDRLRQTERERETRSTGGCSYLKRRLNIDSLVEVELGKLAESDRSTGC